MKLVATIALVVLLIGMLPETAASQVDPLLAQKTDSQGVYLIDYGSSLGGLGTQYNPVSIANYALRLWNRYQETNNEAYLNSFMSQARWLHDNQYADGTWKYTYSIPVYRLNAPWVSCMAQGLGMQVLGYAYSVNNEQSYLEKAKLSLKPFGILVKDGGVRSYFPDGTPWYEEYASDSSPVYKVLNGFMSAIQGIAKYSASNKDEVANTLLREGLSSLDKKIASYDAGYISYYDAAGHINIDYNRIHVEQLLYLYALFGNERFRMYAKRFDTYEPKAGIRASSLVQGQQDPAILVDGKRFNGSVWERRDQSAQLMLDLGSSTSVEGVNFFFADRVNVPSLIQMAISEDGRRWTNVAASAINARGAYYPIDTRDAYIRMHYLKQPEKARFIRIVLNQGPSKLIRLKETHAMYNQHASRFDAVSNPTRWSDVLQSDWYFSYIRALEDSGLATGYADGSFKPNRPITRAELTTWLCRAYNLESTASGDNGLMFSDIGSHWARQYIEDAASAGIIDGFPDGTFKPDEPMTRSELVKIIATAENIAVDPTAQSYFNDVPSEHWAVPYIEAARKANMVTGYGGLVFRPDAGVTRAEAAAILARALGFSPSEVQENGTP